MRPVLRALELLTPRMLETVAAHTIPFYREEDRYIGGLYGDETGERYKSSYFAQYPGISAKEVAHVVRLHPSTITGILQRLTKKGLLLRGPDPVDTRRVRLRVQR